MFAERSVHPVQHPAVKRLATWLRLGVGAALMLFLVFRVGPGELLDTFGQTRPGWVLATILLSAAWFLVGALDVWVLLRRLAPVRFRTFVRVYMTSWATSLVVPGQLGDATQVLLLRRYRVPLASSGASYLADKAITLSWFVLVAAYGLVFYTRLVNGWWVASLLLVLTSAAAGAAWAGRRPPARSSRQVGRIFGAIHRLRSELATLRRHPRAVGLNIAGTLAKWLLMALMYLCAFRAVGGNIAFEAAMTIPVLSSLVGYLPVTVGGLGTVELTAVFLFGQVGVGEASVLSAYLLLRGILLLVALPLLASGR